MFGLIWFLASLGMGVVGASLLVGAFGVAMQASDRLEGKPAREFNRAVVWRWWLVCCVGLTALLFWLGMN